MRRLIDDLYTGKMHGLFQPKDAEFVPPFKMDNLHNAEVVILDNVAQYFFEQEDKGVWFSTDFPNCAPLFENSWYEWKAPHFVLEDNVKKPWMGYYCQAGCLISALDFRDERYDRQVLNAQLLDIYLPLLRARGMEFDEAEFRTNVRWCNTFCPFMRYEPHGQVYELGCLGVNFVEEKGSIYRFRHNDKFATECWWVTRHVKEEEARLLQVAGSTLMFPMWLGISFLHCRNVSTERIDPCHTRKPPKHKKECRRVHYKVLNIHPMQQVIRSEGNLSQQGLKYALSICRGHFKDYSKNGLFGKHKGSYWWHDRLRGSSDKGIIVKDYNVSVSES